MWELGFVQSAPQHQMRLFKVSSVSAMRGRQPPSALSKGIGLPFSNHHSPHQTAFIRQLSSDSLHQSSSPSSSDTALIRQPSSVFIRQPSPDSPHQQSSSDSLHQSSSQSSSDTVLIRQSSSESLHQRLFIRPATPASPVSHQPLHCPPGCMYLVWALIILAAFRVYLYYVMHLLNVLTKDC